MAVLKVFDGTTWVEAPGDHSLSLLGFFNGIFLESFRATITSDGVDITMTLERTGGGDLTMNFSGSQQTTLDCTPALTTDTDTGVLTAGTDAVPAYNYVYIPRSTKVLTASTSDWPSEEHIRVGFFYLPSASFVNTYGGGYINQNWVDHIQDTATGMGHMAHMAERARRLTDVWRSGCGGVATQDGDDLWISVATGVVWQMHKHTFAALDSDTAGAGDPILVANDPDANFVVINSFNEITKLSDGDAIGVGKYVKFILWAAANETGEFQPMFVNVPDEQYNTAADAMADVEGYTNLTIPIPFSVDSSIGFLIMAAVCQNTASGMILQDTTDLRGQTPQTAGGGMGGGDVTALAALTDNAIVRGDGGAKGVQTSGITIDDSDTVSGVGNLTSWKRCSLVLYMETPQVGDEFLLGYVPYPVTFVEVHGASTATSITFNIERRAKTTPDTVGTDILDTGGPADPDLVIDVGGEATTTFAAAGAVAADQWLVVTISAISNAPTHGHVNAEFTID